MPGWIYEALDWVVGVQWPEGNERAVWDLADQWYAVARRPRRPAHRRRHRRRRGARRVRRRRGCRRGLRGGLAGDRRGRRRPVARAARGHADLGRLVEECGCDIEGAKLEVWIELGILVVELLSVAVAAVFTAGAATPAAGAAITATRLLVQQIFKRLMGQLARKSLKHGLKEAGERAAKEVTRGGARGLTRRAARGGAGGGRRGGRGHLATQAYQNSTGRAHGLDLTDLGASAVGGARRRGGGAAGRPGPARDRAAARVGEHLGREMTGEVLADSAASLATGQGLTSMEDVARAAASGATGSATGQTDHALRARSTRRPTPSPGRPSPALPSACGTCRRRSVRLGDVPCASGACHPPRGPSDLGGLPAEASAGVAGAGSSAVGASAAGSSGMSAPGVPVQVTPFAARLRRPDPCCRRVPTPPGVFAAQATC